MLDGFAPVAQRTLVVKTVGVGAARGVWPSKDPANVQDFWLDFSAVVAAASPPDLALSVAYSVVSSAPSLPVVNYAGTDGSMVMLLVGGGTDGDTPIFAVTVTFASGRTQTFSASMPIRSALTLNGQTLAMGPENLQLGNATVDVAGLTTTTQSEAGDGLLLLRPPAQVGLAPELMLFTGEVGGGSSVSIGTLTGDAYPGDSNPAGYALGSAVTAETQARAAAISSESGSRTTADTATLASANAHTDSSVSTLATASALATEISNRGTADAATLASANAHTDSSVATLATASALAAEVSNRGTADAATLASANAHADSGDSTLSTGLAAITGGTATSIGGTNVTVHGTLTLPDAHAFTGLGSGLVVTSGLLTATGGSGTLTLPPSKQFLGTDAGGNPIQSPFTPAAASDLTAEISNRVTADAATLASANAHTDSSVSTLATASALATEVSNRGTADAATLASANAHTDSSVSTLATASALATEVSNRGTADAATLASANAHTDSTAATLATASALATEVSNRGTADAATLASANAHADSGDSTLSTGLAAITGGTATSIGGTNVTVHGTLVLPDANAITGLGSGLAVSAGLLISTGGGTASLSTVHSLAIANPNTGGSTGVPPANTTIDALIANTDLDIGMALGGYGDYVTSVSGSRGINSSFHDDSAAFFGAIAAFNSLYALGITSPIHLGAKVYRIGLGTAPVRGAAKTPLQISGKGSGATTLDIDPNFMGTLFGIDGAADGNQHNNNTGTVDYGSGQAGGVNISGLKINGTLPSVALSTPPIAFGFYGTSEYQILKDIHINLFPGTVLWTGLVGTAPTLGTFREWAIENFVCDDCGVIGSKLPVMVFDVSGAAGDGLNQGLAKRIRLFRCLGAGLVITNHGNSPNRQLYFENVAVEQCLGGPPVQFGTYDALNGCGGIFFTGSIVQPANVGAGVPLILVIGLAGVYVGANTGNIHAAFNTVQTAMNAPILVLELGGGNHDFYFSNFTQPKPSTITAAIAMQAATFTATFSGNQMTLTSNVTGGAGGVTNLFKYTPVTGAGIPANTSVQQQISGTDGQNGAIYWTNATGPSVGIQQGQRSSNVTTIQTSTAHGLSVGQAITIQRPGDATFAGAFTVVSVPSSTTFTISNPGSNKTIQNGGIVATVSSQISCTATYGLMTVSAIVSNNGMVANYDVLSTASGHTAMAGADGVSPIVMAQVSGTANGTGVYAVAHTVAQASDNYMCGCCSIVVGAGHTGPTKINLELQEAQFTANNPIWYDPAVLATGVPALGWTQHVLALAPPGTTAGGAASFATYSSGTSTQVDTGITTYTNAANNGTLTIGSANGQAGTRTVAPNSDILINSTNSGTVTISNLGAGNVLVNPTGVSIGSSSSGSVVITSNSETLTSASGAGVVSISTTGTGVLAIGPQTGYAISNGFGTVTLQPGALQLQAISGNKQIQWGNVVGGVFTVITLLQENAAGAFSISSGGFAALTVSNNGTVASLALQAVGPNTMLATGAGSVVGAVTLTGLTFTGASYTLAVSYGTTAATAAQGNDSRITGAYPLASFPTGAGGLLGSAASGGPTQVTVGTGLTLTTGALAVSYGTAAGTAAQGNDSRITGAYATASFPTTANGILGSAASGGPTLITIGSGLALSAGVLTASGGAGTTYTADGHSGISITGSVISDVIFSPYNNNGTTWYACRPQTENLASAIGTITPVLGQIVCLPIDIRQRCVVKGIGVRVITGAGASAGSLIRLGLFSNQGSNCLPGGLVLDAGTTSADSTGGVSITVSSGPTLTAGTYLATFELQSIGTGTTPTLAGAPLCAELTNIFGGTSAVGVLGTSNCGGIVNGDTSGTHTTTLPSTFPTPTLIIGTAIAPLIALELLPA